MLASGIAVTAGRNSEQRKRTIEEKKYQKRELDGLQGYSFQQEQQEQLYGPPSIPSAPSAPAPPVYEIPAPDLAHPVPGHVPEQPAIAVGHPIG